LPLLTKLTKLQIEEVVHNNYDLGDVKSVFKIKSGWNNTLFKVSTTYGDFLLKVYENTALEQIYAEHEVVNFLMTKKFPTARIIQNKHHEGVTHIDEHITTLFTYINGAPLVVDPFKTVLGTRIAATTSTLHKFNTNGFMYVRTEDLAEILEETVSWYLVDHRLNMFRKEIEDLYSVFEKFRLTALTFGIIHNDLGSDNFLVLENNLKAIIDFDQVAIGSVVKDLSKLFARSVSLNAYSADELSSYMSSFISDYMKGNKLSLEDLHLFVPLFIFQKVLIYIKIKKHLRQDSIQSELFHFEEYIKKLEQELEIIFKIKDKLEFEFLTKLGI